MYYGNGSGMATLLQQKNCMKTLTNGGVSSSSGGGVQSGAAAAVGQTSSSNGTAATNTIVQQQQRMLLPHELGTIPHGNNIAAISGGAYQTPGALILTGYQSQQQSQISDLNNFHNHSTTTSSLHHHHQSLHNPNNSMFSHNNQLYTTSAAAAAAVGTTTTTTTQTRYFSQFSNNQDTNNTIYSTSINNRLLNNSHVYVTNNLTPATNTNNLTNNLCTQITNSNNILHGGFIKQEQLPPNTNSASVIANNHRLSPANGTAAAGGDDSSANTSNNLNGNDAAATTPMMEEQDQEPEPEIDIVINNVVCSFSVRCHLNLREIALNGFNVEFRRENGMVTMKLRRPYTTASIWSSGRITCTGATSEDQAKIAARRYARCLQKLGFRVRFNNFRVVNVLGTCSMPWAIKIVNFSEKYKKDASYEPELHPGVTYKLRFPKATLKIFSTGSITVTAASVANVQAAIEHIFPLVYEFRKKRTPEEMEILRAKQRNNAEMADIHDDVDLHSAKAKKPRMETDLEVVEPNADLPEGIIYSEFDDPDDLIEGPDDEDL